MVSADDVRVITRSLLELTELAQWQGSALSALTQDVAQLAATSAQIATALLRVEARVENLATAQSARASAHSGEISAIRAEVANAVATLATCQTPPVNAAAVGTGSSGRQANARPVGRYRGVEGEQTIIGLAPPANPPGPPPRPKRTPT